MASIRVLLIVLGVRGYLLFPREPILPFLYKTPPALDRSCLHLFRILAFGRQRVKDDPSSCSLV